MNAYAQVVLEIEKDGHVFTFTMPFGSSYGGAFKAAEEMASHITLMEQEARKATEETKASTETSEGEGDGSE